MVPNYNYLLSFLPLPTFSYSSVHGDNTKGNTSGHRTTIIELNSQLILLWDILHITNLWSPLYFIQMHQLQPRCKYYTNGSIGNFILFTNYILVIDDANDNYLYRYISSCC